MNNDYKPNSNRYKNDQQKPNENKKKVEKVIKGTVKTRKKSEIRKFADAFIKEDASNVKTYILTDVLIPAAKKALADIVTGGVNMFLYGDSRRDNSRYSGSTTSYTRYYDKVGGGGSYRASDSVSRSGLSFDDIVFESRGEAELVLTRMDELIENYGWATVSDLYDLVGKTCDYTYDRYGWTSLRNAKAVPIRDGYVLDLPRALPIQK